MATPQGVWWVTGPLSCPNRTPQAGGGNSTSIYSRFWRLDPETPVLPGQSLVRTLGLADAPLADAPGLSFGPLRDRALLSPSSHRDTSPTAQAPPWTSLNLIPPPSSFSQNSPVRSRGFTVGIWGTRLCPQRRPRGRVSHL